MNGAGDIGQSRRMAGVLNPVIPDIAALIRANPGTISLGQGVVHYPPPPQALQAVSRFGGEIGEHHYQAASGIPRLREKLTAKLHRENGIVVGKRQALVVTAGSNMAFYHAILAVCDPGDEVVIASPFYFNHEMAITMASCRPVLAQAGPGYQLDPAVVEACLSGRTRAVVTISPNNPAGVVYPRAVLMEINELCRRHRLYHFSDEAYEYFTYDGAEHFSVGSLRDSEAHTVSLFSFSKSYSLASWRVGYMVTPRHLLRALEKSQDTILICPPVVSQAAAAGALDAGYAFCRRHVEKLSQVRRLCLERLGEVGDLCTVPESDGAFYLLVRLHCSLDSIQVVERLVREFRVAAIPGSGFGMTDGCYIRVAYGALEPDTVAEGMDRLVRGLRALIA